MICPPTYLSFQQSNRCNANAPNSTVNSEYDHGVPDVLNQNDLLTTQHAVVKVTGAQPPLLPFEPPPLIESIKCYFMPKQRQISGVGMGMGFAPTWLRPVTGEPLPLLHKTTLTTAITFFLNDQSIAGIT